MSRLTLGVLMISVALNIGLATAAHRRFSKVVVSSALELIPGELITHIAGATPNGEPVALKWPSEKPTLLYVITPTCPWCTRNAANFDAIVREKADEYQIVLVSLTMQGFREYWEALRLNWTGQAVLPIGDLAQDTLNSLKIVGTPELILISPAGMVEKVWTGAFMNSREEIERLLRVSLPGIDDVPTSR